MRFLVPLLALAMTAAARPGAAQGTLALAADPAPLVVGSAQAGAQPDPADASSSYTLTGVAGTSRITARLGTPLPAGVSLWISLDAPAGAVSRGPVLLSTAEQEVVAGIAPGDHPSLTVTYSLRATAAAGIVPAAAVDVVFSLTPQGP